MVMACFLSVLGMLFSEAHLSYFALSCLALVGTEESFASRWHPVKFGLVASLVFMARLDSVFLLPPLYLWYLKKTGSMAKLSLATVSFASVVTPYLVYNRLVFGSIVPMSGWLKSTFPVVHWRGLVISGLASTLSGYNLFFGLVPLGLAILITFRHRKEMRTDQALSIVVVFVSGALLHALYIFFFCLGGWYWYHVLPMTTFALALGLVLAEATYKPPTTEKWMALAVVACLIVSLVVRVRRNHYGGDRYLSPPQVAMIDFLQNRRVADSVLLVYDWPGALSFYSPKTHVVQADMLMGNQLLFKEMIQSGNALDFLVRYIRQKTTHDAYIVSVPGSPLLPPNATLDRLTFASPRASDKHRVIGQLDVGRPFASLSYARGEAMYLWKVNP
jgi:hypothetical protein